MGTALINHVPETSFPSDHTTLMLSIAITLFLIREERKIGAALFLLGIIGGLTRVFCGIHYPFDILGSLIVAFFSSTLVLCFKGNLVTVNQYIINTYFQIVRKKTAKANSADSKSRATDKQR
jgi:undecaprenyl-diphosphatase